MSGKSVSVCGIAPRSPCSWDPAQPGCPALLGPCPVPRGHLWHHEGLGRGSISSPGKGREGAQGIQLAKPGGTGGKAREGVRGGCQARSQGLALPAGAWRGGVGFSCSSMQ